MATQGKKSTIEAPTAPRFGRVRSNLKMGILGLPNVISMLSFVFFIFSLNFIEF